MIKLDFQRKARKALESDARLIVIIGPEGHGKRTLAESLKRPDDLVTYGGDISPAALKEHYGRVIVLLDKPINQSKLDSRVVTQLVRARIAVINKPTMDERVQALKALGLYEDLIRKAAARVTDFPTLLGITASEPCDLNDLNDLIKATRPEPEHSVDDVVKAIIEVAIDWYGYTSFRMRSRENHDGICRARRMCMFAMRRLTPLGNRCIADIFERDATACSTAVRVVRETESREGERFLDAVSTHLLYNTSGSNNGVRSSR